MNVLDEELGKVLGVNSNWSDYIRNVARRVSMKFSNSAILDDIVTTIITEIYLSATKGKLCEALQKAKTASTNDADLLVNVQGVVTIAAKYRASDERRKIEHYRQFLSVSLDSELDSEIDYEAKSEIVSEKSEELLDGMSRLDFSDRQTLQAFYFEGQSVIEMSERFVIPIGTITQRLHTARTRLKEKLALGVKGR